MKDIKSILKGYDLSSEQIEAIAGEVMQNYRTIAEVEKKDARITELADQVETLNAKVNEASESGAKIDELQAVVNDYKAKEKQREEMELEQAKRDSFQKVFNEALKGKQFTNSLMQESVFDKVYKMCQENNGIGADVAIDTVTKDLQGVWVNPQQDVHKMPGTELIDKTPSKDETKRAFASRLFGSADRN